MRIIGFTALLVTAACSSSTSASSSGAPSDYCATYGNACSSSSSDTQKCHDKCDGKDPSSASTCWFRACGAITGTCDKAEKGDKTIVLCAVDHGWLDACNDLSALCGSSCGDAAACKSTVASGDGHACANYKIANCE